MGGRRIRRWEKRERRKGDMMRVRTGGEGGTVIGVHEHVEVLSIQSPSI